MAFTTSIFLFVFMPIFFIGYFLEDVLERKTALKQLLIKIRAKDIFTIVMGFVFYWCAFYDSSTELVVYVVAVYLAGIILQRYMDADKSKKRVDILFTLIIIAGVALLFYYKYFDFALNTISNIFKVEFEKQNILAPLGISFITFSAISYLADIKMKKAKAGNFIDCCLYMTFFPKIVSGPIILWRDFKGEILNRVISEQNILEGINRICIGFGKKVILADMFGSYVSKIQYATSGIDTPSAWLAAFLYMLQIYYDFAGYSDIAIGLSKIMGFDLKENFNFPYRSLSITEFWRRWHISLGTWFREYIYIPLGGSRRGMVRNLMNLGVVFLVTGIWHGASWNYILWGIANGIVVIAERLMRDKEFYKKIPKVIKWAVTMLIVFFCWQLFRFTWMSDVIDNFLIMAGIEKSQSVFRTWRYYLDIRIVVLSVIGVFGSTILGEPKLQEKWKNFVKKPWGYALQEVALLFIMGLAIMFMLNSSYSPFIYFQY